MKLPNVLLYGPSGTGKTTSILTLVEAGITPFMQITEANALPVVNKVACPNLHYQVVAPGAGSWTALKDALRQVNLLSNDALQKMAGIEKQRYNQILDMVGALGNFKCDRCKEEFGDVESFDDTRAVVLDSLSGLNHLALGNAVGGKPILTQPDWGVSMRSEMMLLQMLTNIPEAMFVLIAHTAMERDEVSGRILKMPRALGTKNAPDLPMMFTDVICTMREGTKFTWSTVEADSVARTAHIPLEANQKPDFGPMISNWRKMKENLTSQHVAKTGSNSKTQATV